MSDTVKTFMTRFKKEITKIIKGVGATKHLFSSITILCNSKIYFVNARTLIGFQVKKDQIIVRLFGFFFLYEAKMVGFDEFFTSPTFYFITPMIFFRTLPAFNPFTALSALVDLRRKLFTNSLNYQSYMKSLNHKHHKKIYNCKIKYLIANSCALMLCIACLRLTKTITISTSYWKFFWTTW